MKAVLISIQPYWVFLIIARIMGWHIDKEKTIEVRKSFPKKQDWNKNVKIYCSKNKKSFSKISKKYQPLMEKFLGKVIGEFVCKGVMQPFDSLRLMAKQSCLTENELFEYSNGKTLYGWRIADLVIYDKPKELSEFYEPLKYDNIGGAKVVHCGHYLEEEAIDFCEFNNDFHNGDCSLKGCNELRKLYQIKRPPQSWCYVEELE